MSKFITYDYAVPISTAASFAALSLNYIRSVLVVCINKEPTETEIALVKATSNAQIEAVTDGKGITDLIRGGLNSVDLIVLPQSDKSIVSAKDAIASFKNQVLTVFIADEVIGTVAEITNNAKLEGGVIVKSFKSDDLEDAKLLASTECAFVDNDQSIGGMYYAFAKMLSNSVTWLNQQYLLHGKTASEYTVADVGTAESYFNDRLSFYIDDDSLGRNLGFFVAGGASIVDRYVRAEVARQIQETGLIYIQKNAPNNSENQRDLLTLECRGVFDDYEDAGLLVAGGSELTITEHATDGFIAAGSFKMELPVALWRFAVSLEG